MADGGKEPDSADNSWNSWLGGWVQAAKDNVPTEEGWLGGWVQTAKEKANTGLEFVRKDLAEFTCTMQKETEKVVEKTSSQLKDSLNHENTTQATSRMKAGMTSFLDNISKMLVIPPDDDDSVPMKVAKDGSGLYDRGKARLHALQLDASTFIDPPRGPPEQFAMWLESFDADQHKGEISELLVTKAEVRALYTKLVPNEVSNAEFWQRYFFRVHQLDVDEARKKALMSRADQTSADSSGWDDDDDDDWSGGEEDDGNLSDWEKLGKPSHSQPDTSAATKSLKAEKYVEETSLQETDCSSEPLALSEPLASSASASYEAVKSVEVISHQEFVCSPEPLVSSDASSSVTKDSVDQCEVQPEACQSVTNYDESSSHAVNSSHESNTLPPCDSSAEGPTHVKDNSYSTCVSESSPAPQVQASGPEETDTGSAGTCDEQIPSQTETESITVELSQGEVACAAASGSDVLPSEDIAQQTADGACGAADMQAYNISFVPEDEKYIQEVNMTAASISRSQSEEEKDRHPSSTSTSSQEPVSSVNASDVPQTSAPASVTALAAKTAQTEDEPSLNLATQQNTNDEAALSQLTDQAVVEKMPVNVKGDMVVVGNRLSPSSGSIDSKGLEEDWEQDFDIELTEEDLKAAEDVAKRLGESLNDEDDDWENWE